ncbi:MAG: trimeric intracellular cation channel family protein [Clostridiales bacterium]|nr:trimeric intracellular cation channel family protein [Clostridiales bacterium]
MHIILLFEIIGTVAFAVSGASVGIQKKMDIFGVAILGLTTAVGGGIVRDLILDVAPPVAFQEPLLPLIAIAASLILFLSKVRGALMHMQKVYDILLLCMDSLGLGLFTVVGVQVAQGTIASPNDFLVTFVGVLTGVGGGILRDVFAGDTPHVFVKHFYASASIIGAWTCALMWPAAGATPSMVAGAVAVIVLRMLAARYHWSLPKAK